MIRKYMGVEIEVLGSSNGHDTSSSLEEGISVDIKISVPGILSGHTTCFVLSDGEITTSEMLAFNLESDFRDELREICKNVRRTVEDEDWYQVVFLTMMNWAKSKGRKTFEIVLNKKQFESLVFRGHTPLKDQNTGSVYTFLV